MTQPTTNPNHTREPQAIAITLHEIANYLNVVHGAAIFSVESAINESVPAIESNEVEADDAEEPAPLSASDVFSSDLPETTTRTADMERRDAALKQHAANLDLTSASHQSSSSAASTPREAGHDRPKVRLVATVADVKRVASIDLDVINGESGNISAVQLERGLAVMSASRHVYNVNICYFSAKPVVSHIDLLQMLLPALRNDLNRFVILSTFISVMNAEFRARNLSLFRFSIDTDRKEHPIVKSVLPTRSDGKSPVMLKQEVGFLYLTTPASDKYVKVESHVCQVKFPGANTNKCTDINRYVPMRAMYKLVLHIMSCGIDASIIAKQVPDSDVAGVMRAMRTTKKYMLQVLGLAPQQTLTE